MLPANLLVFERGWLSSNNILFLEGEQAALIDSGYVSHASQTVALLEHALAGRRLTRLLNTHSHSDHIGGNAAVSRGLRLSCRRPRRHRRDDCRVGRRGAAALATGPVGGAFSP
jgi:glyoxylase-like metal-dependent hydrolase (beta-lactamase superfamily II)